MAQQHDLPTGHGWLLRRPWKLLALPLSLLQMGWRTLLRAVCGVSAYYRHSSGFYGAHSWLEVLARRYWRIQGHPPEVGGRWSCIGPRLVLHRGLLQRHHCVVDDLPLRRLQEPTPVVSVEHSRRLAAAQALP